jgi:uncharacterized protein (TIGR03000 family)
MNRVLASAVVIVLGLAASGTAKAHDHGCYHHCHGGFHPYISFGWYPAYPYVGYDPYYYYPPRYVYTVPQESSSRYYYDNRSVPAQPRSEPVPPPPAGAVLGRSARIEVRVPAPDAEVVFDGQRTTSVGRTRVLETPELEPGQSYSARVAIRWNEDGRQRTDERNVDLTAGGSVLVDFTRPTPAERVAIPAGRSTDSLRR